MDLCDKDWIELKSKPGASWASDSHAIANSDFELRTGTLYVERERHVSIMMFFKQLDIMLFCANEITVDYYMDLIKKHDVNAVSRPSLYLNLVGHLLTVFRQTPEEFVKWAEDFRRKQVDTGHRQRIDIINHALSVEGHRNGYK